LDENGSRPIKTQKWGGSLEVDTEAEG
jgi:hypothetical protein